MALDFPNSPIDGQVYDNYYWDEAQGVWNSIGNYDIPSLLANGIFTSSGSSVVPLTVKGAPSQAANLQEWKNNSNTTLASISASGGLTLNNALTVGNGGTGTTSLTSGAYLKGNGSNAIQTQTGIPAGDITSGQIAAARMPTGSIVQVVQTNFITRSSQSYSNATVTDITGLSASITPKSTSSRIMIFARWFGELSPADATYNIVFGVKRNGTRVGEGTDNGSTVIRAITTSAISYDQQDVSSTPETMSFFYLDDPATTSSVTYQVFFIANVGAGSGVIAHNKTYNWTGQVNGFELGTSNITLMEVA